jgi:catechol 2,3-dioxygenase-like lactoylglutathione lyase family enzyme
MHLSKSLYLSRPLHGLTCNYGFRPTDKSVGYYHSSATFAAKFSGDALIVFRSLLAARGIPMKRLWTIIGVDDVPASCRWYQSLLGLPETPPAHDYFGQILDADGTVLLCLHSWGAHEHPSLTSPDSAQPGNGFLLFFRVDDFELALSRARALVAPLEEEPNLNPNTGTMEFALRDPDGYYVMISALA